MIRLFWITFKVNTGDSYKKVCAVISKKKTNLLFIGETKQANM